MKYVMTLTAVLTIGTAQGVLSSGCSDDSGLSQESRYVGIATKAYNNIVFVDFAGRQVSIPDIEGCSGDVDCYAASWSRDGRKVLIGGVSCALDIQTRQCEPVDPHFFSWSQDSDHALFYDSDSHMLYRGKLDGSEREDLVAALLPITVSPDESLAVGRLCPTPGDFECDWPKQFLTLLDLRAGEDKSFPCVEARYAQAGVGAVEAQHWFSDSRTILMTDTYPDGNPYGKVWLCDVETGEIKTLVDEDYEHAPDLESRWFPVSPDERYVAFLDSLMFTTGFTVVDMQSKEKWFVELDQAVLLAHGYTYDSLYMLVGQGDDLFGYDLQDRKLTKLPIQDMYPRMSPVAMTLPKW